MAPTFGEDGAASPADGSAASGTAAEHGNAASDKPADASKSPAGSARAGQLSQRTLKIMTELEGAPHATALGRGRDADDVDTEEAREEARLVEMERAGLVPGPGFAGEQRKKGAGKRDARYDLQVKMLLLGDSAVGKTSLLNRYSEGVFSESTISTTGYVCVCLATAGH